jgi:hypothetical protein
VISYTVEVIVPFERYTLDALSMFLNVLLSILANVKPAELQHMVRGALQEVA